MNMACLLTHNWDNQQILPKLVRFLGGAFGTERGFNQNDLASPMIFNIVVHAVARVVLAEVYG